MPRQTYIAYLDEFGHIGPFVSKDDPRHNTSPLFGIGGILIPADQVRYLSTWFYQLKCNLLQLEISRDGIAPYLWEKKGSSLYTSANITKYRELRAATFRLINKISSCEGRIFYVGIEKTANVMSHKPNEMMLAIIREAIKRLDQHCTESNSGFIVFLDQHVLRSDVLTATQKEMYGPNPRRTLVEAPTQVESHRYQLMQAADWMCGLIGRIETYKASPSDYKELSWTDKYFASRLSQITVRSGVRKQTNLSMSSLPVLLPEPEIP